MHNGDPVVPESVHSHTPETISLIGSALHILYVIATVALSRATVLRCWCYQCRRSSPVVVSMVASYVIARTTPLYNSLRLIE